MNYETILLEKDSGIAWVTLNRPQALNAVNEAMGHEYIEVMEELSKDNDVRVVVVRAAGKAFCAGADVNAFMALVEARERGEPGVLHPDFRRRVPIIMRNMPQPTIAAVQGNVLGLGFTIALNCDMRIAAEDARFGTGHVRLGLCPECGSTYLLPRLIGLPRAMELALTGRVIGAQEAYEIGMLNRVVALDKLPEATLELARGIAAAPPLAVPVIKRLVHSGLNTELAAQVEFEATSIAGLFQTRDHSEAVRAFFQKRPAVFTGR
ncbi:MAG: enoyl-CoA hydratase/isomerase family protein [Chloroflexi bacterium]|nr:enoyl-CoA hydratase/isomerase family protein [Chloroflexota bacterium]